MARKEFMRLLFDQLYPPQKSLAYQIVEAKQFFALRDEIMTLGVYRA